MKRIDTNKNGIPDYIESYALMFVSLFLIIFGCILLYNDVTDEVVSQTAMRLILYGLGGLAGDRVVENFRR